jgi:hypothetical protein
LYADVYARQVRVHTEGGRISSDGPDTGRGRGYSVSYLILVPRRMDLSVETHNGPVGVEGVTGRIQLTAVNEYTLNGTFTLPPRESTE